MSHLELGGPFRSARIGIEVNPFARVIVRAPRKPKAAALVACVVELHVSCRVKGGSEICHEPCIAVLNIAVLICFQI